MSRKTWLGSASELLSGHTINRVLRDLSGIIVILPIEVLKPHEGVDPEAVDRLMREIERDGFLRKPILVDMDTLAVLDGHHRIAALRRLGYKRVPCLLINYSSDKIRVFRWGSGEPIPKKTILNASLRGELMLPKTTRHVICDGERHLHASEIEPDLNIPLHELLPKKG